MCIICMGYVDVNDKIKFVYFERVNNTIHRTEK